MSCCNNTCQDIKIPMPQPCCSQPGCGSMGNQIQGPGPVIPNASMPFMADRFPVGMGYVPMQPWQTPYPMGQGFMRGTIFPALDYPFEMGRCR